MKRFLILAISAVIVANGFAQEEKKECKGKQLSQEERVEFEIKRLSKELYLSDKQAEKFAVTFREYAGKRAELFSKKCSAKEKKELSDAELDKLAKKRFATQKEFAALQEKYYDKFRKDLSARQVQKILRLNEPCGKKQGKHHAKQHRPHVQPAQLTGK